MTDFRALCKELVDALLCWQTDGAWIDQAEQSRLIARARAALAQPGPPSLKEQALALIDSNKPYLDDTAMDTIRRALEALND